MPHPTPAPKKSVMELYTEAIEAECVAWTAATENAKRRAADVSAPLWEAWEKAVATAEAAREAVKANRNRNSP